MVYVFGYSKFNQQQKNPKYLNILLFLSKIFDTQCQQGIKVTEL